MAGGVVRFIVEKIKGTDEEKKERSDRGVLFTSGLIAGKGIMGIVLAVTCSIESRFRNQSQRKIRFHDSAVRKSDHLHPASVLPVHTLHEEREKIRYNDYEETACLFAGCFFLCYGMLQQPGQPASFSGITPERPFIIRKRKSL